MHSWCNSSAVMSDALYCVNGYKTVPSVFPRQSTVRVQQHKDLTVCKRSLDEFTTEPTDVEQQLIDCYFELPTRFFKKKTQNCSFHSGCNLPRKRTELWSSEKPKAFPPPVCLRFKIRITFRGFLCSAKKHAKSLKVCWKNASGCAVYQHRAASSAAF